MQGAWAAARSVSGGPRWTPVRAGRGARATFVVSALADPRAGSRRSPRFWNSTTGALLPLHAIGLPVARSEHRLAGDHHRFQKSSLRKMRRAGAAGIRSEQVATRSWQPTPRAL